MHNYTSLKKLATSRFALNILFKLKKELPASTDMQTVVAYNFVKRNKTDTFIDTTLNMCSFLTHVKMVPLVNLVLIKLTQSSNQPFECPIKAVSFIEIVS